MLNFPFSENVTIAETEISKTSGAMIPNSGTIEIPNSESTELPMIFISLLP